jgi:hypothetical protein
MGLDFKIYEDLNNDVDLTSPHEIEEKVYLTQHKAMLIVNWFYRKDTHIGNLKDVYGESNHYIKIYGDDIWEIKVALEKVLNEEVEWKKDLLAYHYFPVLYTIPDYISSVEMWSEEYYNDLTEIYETLKELMPTLSVYNKERTFFYNISW